MDNKELIKRLSEIEEALDKMAHILPQASMIAYKVWHLKREIMNEINIKQ